MSVWIATPDGIELLDDADAKVSVFDHGFTVGDGLFETIRTSAGRPEFLEMHLARMEKSAQRLGLAMPTREVVVDGIEQVVRSSSGIQLGRMRVTVTSGSSQPGAIRDGGWTCVVTHVPYSSSDAPVALTVSQYRIDKRSPLAGHKCTSYAREALALNEARAQHFDDAIFLNYEDEVVETTSCNIFAVKNGVIITPSVTTGCLPGIMREVILEMFPANFRMAQIPFSLNDLLEADEVFVTSSLRGILPVRTINDKVFDHESGDLTRRLQLELSSLLKVAGHD